MKIACNGQMLTNKNKTGIAWTAHNLIMEFVKNPENECIIQSFSLFQKKTKMQSLEVYEKAGCRIENCRWFNYACYKILWLIVPVPYRIFFPSRPDVVQFFDFTAPPGVKGKCVTFIHDMAYRSCPQAVRFKTRNWLRASLKRSCAHADHIITISNSSKRDIIKYLKVPEEKITVVPCAADHSLYHPGYTKAQMQETMKKYKIGREYFLYLGTIEPRKNLERMICAYEKLVHEKDKQKENVPLLVLAGAKGWKCRGIYKKVEELHLKGSVRLIGYVDQEDSPVLMCGALAFVFPSIYEGFGMPPLEAMACATPVIASRASSLPEVVGDAGILVDPASVDEIYCAMKKLLEDTEYQKELGMRGRQRAQAYTWEASANKLLEVYKKLCKNGQQAAAKNIGEEDGWNYKNDTVCGRHRQTAACKTAATAAAAKDKKQDSRR